MSWSAAEMEARRLGGNLVTIEDASENQWIFDHFPVNNWIGLYREANSDLNSASWKWTSGSQAGYRNWDTGQPNNDPILSYYVFMESAYWNDAPNEQARPALIEFDRPTTLSFPEPVGFNILNWLGSSLAIGTLRPNLPATSSVFYAFVDDRNANGVADAGDEFVLAEYLYSGTNATMLPPKPRTIEPGVTNRAYGSAVLDNLSGTNQTFFTAEPDGRVFFWTATNAADPLQGHLFSAHHAGKAWHALAGVKTLESGEGLVGLRVDPATPNRCDVIFWPPQPELWKPIDFPQTAPIAAVLPSTNSLSTPALIKVRLWDAEGSPSLPLLQYQVDGTTNWTDAKILLLDNSLYTADSRVAAPPAGSEHSLVWEIPAGQFPDGTSTSLWLRASAKDITMKGAWSQPVSFRLEIADSDRDGLPDAWEMAHFGDLSQGPADDPDGDGLTNLQELLIGTEPTAPNLELSIELSGNTIKLDWLGVPGRRQILEETQAFEGTAWVPVWTNDVALSGSVTILIRTNQTWFYRLRLEE